MQYARLTMANDIETAIANVFDINLPEDDIDDEGVLISGYAYQPGLPVLKLRQGGSRARGGQGTRSR